MFAWDFLSGSLDTDGWLWVLSAHTGVLAYVPASEKISVYALTCRV